MALVYTRYARRGLSTSQREQLYDRCRGDNAFPTCNLCGCPVDGVHQAWDESHFPVAATFGGSETGVAHRACNRRHNHEVVTPQNAKSNRVRQNFIGAAKSRYPMPGGRDDRIKRTLSGRVVARGR